MEITIKRPDFQRAINGVIFDNEDNNTLESWKTYDLYYH